jgi:hypothetical protein
VHLAACFLVVVVAAAIADFERTRCINTAFSLLLLLLLLLGVGCVVSAISLCWLSCVNLQRQLDWEKSQSRSLVLFCFSKKNVTDTFFQLDKS